MAANIILSEDGFKILTVEDTVKKYTPELSNNDIKAFVWYNRTLGIPMNGFEKWFIANTKTNVVTAIEDVNYLNQSWEVIGKFQKGDSVGKVTRFENEYNGITYVAVRKFDNSLCMVDKGQLDMTNIYEASMEELNELVKSKSLMYLNGMFLPLHVYTNTDYDTLRSQLEYDKEYMIKVFGEDVYEYHKSIISTYVSMSINHPIKDKRYKLNPFGDIARNTMAMFDDYEDSISGGFLQYVRTLKNSDFELVSKDVFMTRVVYGNERVGKSYGASSKEEKDELKEKTEKEVADSKLECERLFSDFLCNNLDSDTVKILNKKINETYNRSILVNTNKIPIGFKCSNKIKNGNFSLQPVQQEAFKFAISRNNFCLALTVGFGKTSVCISILSYLIGTGTIKKPLVIVPKPVMKNWQKELFGFWTNGKLTSFEPINGWERNYGVLSDCGFEFFNIQNLNKSIIKKSSEIAKYDKCIVLGTYEALQKMYISDEEVRAFIIDRWKDILEQGTKDGEEETARESSKKLSSLISKLNKVDRDAEIDMFKLGFDSIYFDEAHRLKNLFSGVTADKTNRVKSGFKGNPSDRSLRAFFITQYFQKIKGRVGFLTATPFSNSPLEVYTMLVFLNYSELVKNNVYKIINFVEIFFNETTEYKVNSKNEIVTEAVMKSYKNKPILYKILSNTFIYKNDPKKAGIQRPCIIRYPNKDIKLILKQSKLQQLQRDILIGKKIDYEVYSQAYPEIEPYLEEFIAAWKRTNTAKSTLGLAGKIMSASKSSALSPFCNSPLALPFITDEAWRELYEHSPKIRFTIDCISNMLKYHDSLGEATSSFLIYMGIGTNLLEPFKKALEVICGFQSNLSVDLDEDEDDGKKSKITFDEVEIIQGSADSDKEADRRERVGELFNKGKVKVIIGTDTIKEGLNLQTNCATLFVLTPTWNSTDIKQVEGRIHRQNNKFAYARIITPLVTKTLDSFIYQKYEEKESRLTDIWEDDGLSTTGNLDVQVPPSKQKELILDDAIEIAKIRSEINERTEINQYDKINDEYESLSDAIRNSTKYKFFVDYFTSRLPKVKSIADENLFNLKAMLESFDVVNDDEEVDQVPRFLRRFKDRMKTLVEYYGQLVDNIQKALDSNLIVDMINIFGGKFKQRSYNLNIDYYDINEFNSFCSKLNLSNQLMLLDEDIFKSIGVSRRTKSSWEKGDYESIYSLSEIYSSCFNAEKYILNPEGLSLTSSTEELNATLIKFKQRLDDKVSAISLNFDIDDNKYNGFRIKPKEEYMLTLINSARIELDEENKLSKEDDKLASYFTEKTNIQLSYKIRDIDLEKCDIPYKEVNIRDIISSIDTIENIPKDYSSYKKLYDSIKKVVIDLDTIKLRFQEKSGKNGDAIMPLTVELQDLPSELNIIGKHGYKLIMEQNYIQEGDVMTDPRIDFAIYQDENIAIPLNYEMNGMGMYVEYVDNGKIINQKNLNDTVNFCVNTWMPNLVEQDRIIGKPIEVKEAIEETKKPLTPFAKKEEKSKLTTISDSFFNENPNKIIGEQTISDFRNMIIVKGTKQDVISYFDKELESTPKEEEVIDNVDIKLNELEEKQKEAQKEQIIEEVVYEPTEKDILDTIESLQVLADFGDESVLDTIEALKILI